MLTHTQKEAAKVWYEKHKNIKGDYRSSMVYGLVTAYTSSGICSDAYSEADSIRVDAAGLNKPNSSEDPDYADYSYAGCHSLQEINDKVKLVDGNTQNLQCIVALTELMSIVDEDADPEETLGEVWDLFGDR